MFKLILATILLICGISLIYWLSLTNMSTPNDPIPVEKLPIPESAAVATLAGGCFWCIEAAYEGGLIGIYEAISGYTGGAASDASYRLIAEGSTGHREAVQVYFEPSVVTYEEILGIFWQQIDPTDEGGQFADRGFHYSTAIFYHDETQRAAAEKSKQELIDSGRFEDPIVTEILPAMEFYPAEENHQDFARKRSGYYKAYKYGSGRGGFIEKTWGE